MKKKSIIYKTTAGIEAYVKYVDSLKDRKGAAKIRIRVTRTELGNFGDHKKIGRGIIELRIDEGSEKQFIPHLVGKFLSEIRNEERAYSCGL